MGSDRGKLSLTAYGAISHQLLIDTKIGDVKTTEAVLKAMDRLVEHDLKIMRKMLKQ